MKNPEPDPDNSKMGDYLSLSDVATLLNSEDWMVRAQVVFSESLTTDQVEQLLTDPDLTVRKMAADLNRDISEEVILRVIHKYPQDMGHFTLHASAPGIVLGHRALNWVGEPDLERYLDYRTATAPQRARMTALWSAMEDRMLTLAALWNAACGGV